MDRSGDSGVFKCDAIQTLDARRSILNLNANDKGRRWHRYNALYRSQFYFNQYKNICYMIQFNPAITDPPVMEIRP